MQPLVKDNGVIRFKANKIVRALLDAATDAGVMDMNKIALNLHFSQEDMEQFAQLIGYSLGGYQELSYVSDKSVKKAKKKARKKFPQRVDE